MTVRQLILNLFSNEKTIELSTVAFAGSFNVGSGFAEFKSTHFPSCVSCTQDYETVRKCKSCGRRAGNTVQVPIARGQVAAGASLYVGSKLMGSIFVFDDRNIFAESIFQKLDGGSLIEIDFQNWFYDKFIEALNPYADFPCYELGSVTARYSDASDVGFVAGDSHSGDVPYATVDHPYSNGEFKVLIFSEPFGAATGQVSEVSNFFIESGKAPPVIPRLALVLQVDYASSVLKGIEPGRSESAIQTQMMSAGRLSDAEVDYNAGVTNFMNGLFWNFAAWDQTKFYRDRPGSDEQLNLYMSRSFGFFVQGAVCGNEDSRLFAQQDAAALPELLEQPALRDSLQPRGLPSNLAISDLLFGDADDRPGAGLLSSFCEMCGKAFNANSKFCSSCGTKR